MRTGKWMVAAVLLGSSTLLMAQGTNSTKDDLFAGTEKFAQNATSVTEIDQTPDSLINVTGPNSPRAKRTVLNVVHTYEYDKPGMYNMADVDVFRAKLNSGDWHCSVHVREMKSGESTDVCQRHRTDGLEESAIITVEPKELTFIHTIRRPSTSGQSGGGDSWLMVPNVGAPLFGGMPASAWAATMRAQAAEDRAEIASIHPEMLADMARLRANLRSGADFNVQSPMSADQLQQLRQQAEHFRDFGGLQPLVPAPPARPLAPAGPNQ